MQASSPVSCVVNKDFRRSKKAINELLKTTRIHYSTNMCWNYFCISRPFNLDFLASMKNTSSSIKANNCKHTHTHTHIHIYYAASVFLNFYNCSSYDISFSCHTKCKNIMLKRTWNDISYNLNSQGFCFVVFRPNSIDKWKQAVQ